MKMIRDIPLNTADTGIDLNAAVRELHGLGSQEISKLLREADNFIIHLPTGNGATIDIDMEKLAMFLPMHLMAVLLSSRGDEPASLRYLLCGFRLLHVLCDLAPRYNKLEQVKF
ncbi:Nodulin homeobox [Linum grandiflorum]